MYRNGAFFPKHIIYFKPNANRFLTMFLLWLIFGTVFLQELKKSRNDHNSRMLGEKKPLCLWYWERPQTQPLSCWICIVMPLRCYSTREASILGGWSWQKVSNTWQGCSPQQAVRVLIVLSNSPQIQLNVDWRLHKGCFHNPFWLITSLGVLS